MMAVHAVVKTKMKQPFAVWPYYALAIIAGTVGGVLLYFNLGSEVPKREDLQKFSGTIANVVLVDDLSGEPMLVVDGGKCIA